MPTFRTCAVLLLLSFLLAPAAGAATTTGAPSVPAPAAPFHALGADPTPADAFSLRGDRLAWAATSVQEKATAILLTNLTTGATTKLSSVPGGRTGDIDSLSYDGRWVVWSDRRFGRFNLYAVEAATGQLTRLTDITADDTHANVDAGVVVWTRGSTLESLTLPSRQMTTLAVLPGHPGELAFHDGVLAWTQQEGGDRILAVQALAGGPLRTFHGTANATTMSQAFDPWIGAGRVVWEQRLSTNPKPPRIPAPISSVIRSFDLTTGEVVNLTGPSLVGHPSAGDGRVAWVEATTDGVRLNVLDLASQRTTTLDGWARRAQMDAGFLVVQQGNGDETPTPGMLYAVAWSDVGRTPWALLGLGAAAVAVVAGIPFLLSRARRRRPASVPAAEAAEPEPAKAP